jgi:hypothetical protein
LRFGSEKVDASRAFAGAPPSTLMHEKTALMPAEGPLSTVFESALLH